MRRTMTILLLLVCLAPLISQQEKRIADLRRPVTHSYDVVKRQVSSAGQDDVAPTDFQFSTRHFYFK